MCKYETVCFGFETHSFSYRCAARVLWTWSKSFPCETIVTKHTRAVSVVLVSVSRTQASGSFRRCPSWSQQGCHHSKINLVLSWNQLMANDSGKSDPLRQWQQTWVATLPQRVNQSLLWRAQPWMNRQVLSATHFKLSNIIWEKLNDDVGKYEVGTSTSWNTWAFPSTGEVYC